MCSILLFRSSNADDLREKGMSGEETQNWTLWRQLVGNRPRGRYQDKQTNRKRHRGRYQDEEVKKKRPIRIDKYEDTKTKRQTGRYQDEEINTKRPI